MNKEESPCLSKRSCSRTLLREISKPAFLMLNNIEQRNSAHPPLFYSEPRKKNTNLKLYSLFSDSFNFKKYDCKTQMGKYQNNI